MKITVDTNFLVSAIQWDYSVSHKLLMKLLEKEVKIFTTKDILEEFSEILERDFRYASEEISNILGKVRAFITLIETTSNVDIVKDDLDDNKIIACAVDSLSEYVISYDKHLLKLQKYEGIRIITPEEAMGVFDIMWKQAEK